MQSADAPLEDGNKPDATGIGELTQTLAKTIAGLLLIAMTILLIVSAPDGLSTKLFTVYTLVFFIYNIV